MSLQNLIKKLQEEFEHEKYEEAQKDAGELGRQIELIIGDMLKFDDGSLIIQENVFDRIGYESVAETLLYEMEKDTKAGIYKQSTLAIYKCLLRYVKKEE